MLWWKYVLRLTVAYLDYLDGISGIRTPKKLIFVIELQYSEIQCTLIQCPSPPAGN